MSDGSTGRFALRVTPAVRRALAERTARCGSYRIIYRIDDNARTVTVVDVDHPCRRGDPSPPTTVA
ncbi:MAG: type II toxin-antitoxin system RelE family toxin [Pseudonocardiaceae bacterium]